MAEYGKRGVTGWQIDGENREDFMNASASTGSAVYVYNPLNFTCCLNKSFIFQN